MAWRLILCSRSSNSWIYPPALLYSHSLPRPAASAKERERRDGLKVYGRSRPLRSACLIACRAKKRSGMVEDEQQAWEDGRPLRQVQQAALWAAEAAYILWLFLLPYAPVCLFCLFSGILRLLAAVRCDQSLIVSYYNIRETLLIQCVLDSGSRIV